MAFLLEKTGYTQRRAPAAQVEQRHREACLDVEDEAFQEKVGYMDEIQSVKDGADVAHRELRSHFREGRT